MGERELQLFSSLLNETELEEIKKKINTLKSEVLTSSYDEFTFAFNESIVSVNREYLLAELDQILKTRTVNRTHYYLKRLIKSLTENKTSKINDLNLNRWKEYDDIVTDSLWVMNKRDKSGAHTAGYWGNFIPQIPNQFLRRYTKRGEWILDAFAGSGTTLIECKHLQRNGLGIELNPEVVKLANNNIKKDKNKSDCISKVILGDSTQIDLKSKLKKAGTNSVQFVFLHPPYWDIIKFSNKKNDLSNAKNTKQFLSMFGKVVDNCSKILDSNRYLAVVIGDKYSDGEWIPLGFYTMQEVMKRGFKLKSTIVKNFETTKGKRNQKELWRYRALAGGFYIFKHEYIFLFKKGMDKSRV